ncbi:MAG TPA: response regulator [Gemmatimonadaceae bacterium]|nr:response regulator [Gemmatimonadaceae bacterium]
MPPALVPRVLVVDDEPTICRALSIALRRAGYEPRSAESAEAAQSLLRHDRFDAMIVDLRIPDQRGDEFFELAAALYPHLRTATLMTTGDTSDRALDLIGACRVPYLVKPFDLAELIAAIDGFTNHVRDASA